MDFADKCDNVTFWGLMKGTKSMRKILILMAVSLLASCSTAQMSEREQRFIATEQARLDTELRGLTPGKPKSCISLRDARGTESFGESTLLFRVGRKLVYRTDTRGSCRSIGNGRALVIRAFGSELCRGDLAESIDTATRSSYSTCQMGEFIPYRGS
jgi:hypothetical protein